MKKTCLCLIFFLFAACSPVPPTPSAITPTTAEITSTSALDLVLYSNTVVGFSFLYPKESVFTFFQDLGYPHIDLPFQPGTNLQEKYVEIYTHEGECDIRPDLEASEIEFGKTRFTFQYSSNAGMGSYYDWENYSTFNGTNCVKFAFVFHSTNPANYDQPPPVFDADLERAVIEQILSTFIWL